jgi:hypothetical protein
MVTECTFREKAISAMAPIPTAFFIGHSFSKNELKCQQRFYRVILPVRTMPIHGMVPGIKFVMSL